MTEAQADQIISLLENISESLSRLPFDSDNEYTVSAMLESTKESLEKINEGISDLKDIFQAGLEQIASAIEKSS